MRSKHAWCVLAGLLLLFGLQVSGAHAQVARPAAKSISRLKTSVRTRAPSGVYLGVSVHQWSTSDLLSNLAQYQKDANKKAALVMYWRDWSASGQIDPAVMNAVYAQNSVPFIAWEPECWSCTDQSAYSLDKIAAGAFDSYIRSFANSLKGYGKTVFLRFGSEMNGCWRPYGCQPSTYVAAWRHVHDLFVATGATNVKWVWCPNIDWDGKHPLAPYYPGDAYVDWLGLDGYNQTWNGWSSFVQIFKSSIAELNAINAGYPIAIGETASAEPTVSQTASGLSKSSWITDAYKSGIPSFSRIKAVSWFNQDKSAEEGCPCDWRIESDTAGMSAFAKAVSGLSYRATYP